MPGLKKSVCATLAATLFIFSSSCASAKETVIWTLNDLIPFYIQEGPFKGQGISDKLTTYFQERLPEYNHKQEQMNFTRFFALVKRGDLVCNPLLLKTNEREEFLSYSTPFKPAYAHVLVSKNPQEYAGPAISFEKFLQDEKAILIIQKKRSYGPVLDQIIKEARKENHIEDHLISTKQLFVMLENARIDHFIDVESSAVYYQKLNPAKGPFYNVSIKEDRLDRFGYAVCSKTLAGQILIGKINQIIEKEKESIEFRFILESWMADENKARFRSFYEREILKR